MDEPTCTIDGCDKPVRVKSRGWCITHYERWRRHGDPLKVVEPAQPSEPDGCAVDDCAKAAKGRGWCSAHYERWRQTGDVNADVPLTVRLQPHAPGAQCAVEGCEDWPGSRGWCRKHWDRWRRNGDPLVVKVMMGADPRVRIGSHVDRSGGPDACHPWTGSQTPDGYGWSSLSRQPMTAHMAAWIVENGPKPPGTDLDHECHNRAVRDGLCKPGKCLHRLCCNLRHIILRTRAEHAAATTRWPGVRGEDNKRAKLTEQQVLELRELLKNARGEQMAEIGRRYGIGRTQAYRIKRGEAWTWLPDAA